VGTKNLDQPFVLPGVALRITQIKPAGAERAARRVPQRREGERVFLVQVEDLLVQHPEDTVARGVAGAEVRRMRPHGLNHPPGARIDHRGDPSGLGVQRILGHRFLPR